MGESTGTGNGGNGRESRGVQAYRWIVMAALAVLAALSAQVLSKIEKTADVAAGLQAVAGVLGSRLDTHAERINGHDRKIDRLEDRVFVKGHP